jgi:hypothetical protein
MQSTTKRLSAWAVIVLLMLLVPFFAMRFHLKSYDPGSGFEEIAWTVRDFIFAAIALYGAGFAYIMVTRNTSDSKRRLIIGIIVFLILAFIWVGAATGFAGILPDQRTGRTGRH